VDVITAAPFNSGILATGVRPGARYSYEPASKPILDAVSRMEAICAEFGLPLGAAALQMPLRFRPVKIVLPGFSTVKELAQGFDWFGRPVGDKAWQALSAVEP
jgi:D-threo-aldose 1-dehydrogenase